MLILLVFSHFGWCMVYYVGGNWGYRTIELGRITKQKYLYQIKLKVLTLSLSLSYF